MKREIIGKIIRDLQMCQRNGYNIQITEPIYSFILELPHHGIFDISGSRDIPSDPKELYDISTLREPKDSDLRTVEQLEHEYEERRKFTQ